MELPVLEATLLVLEAADSGEHSKTLSSLTGHFISALATCLSQAMSSSTPGWPCSSEPRAAATGVAAATALRCLESIAGRSRIIVLTPSDVAAILQVPLLLFASHGPGRQPFQLLGLHNGAGAFVAAARAMTAVLRNHSTVARRCMALATASSQSLLLTWMTWQKSQTQTSENSPAVGVGPSKEECTPQQRRHAPLSSCAAAMAAVWAATAENSDLARYCVHLLADYINIVLLHDHERPSEVMLQSSQSSPGLALQSAGPFAALRSGAYQLYGACSTGEVQHLYMTVGSKGSGIGRTLLGDLQKDYERYHKYSGKI